ncbi:MAG TPA: hypothetical protein VGC58_02330 [Candidatus Paceibacterota bacterium]
MDKSWVIATKVLFSSLVLGGAYVIVINNESSNTFPFEAVGATAEFFQLLGCLLSAATGIFLGIFLRKTVDDKKKNA